MASMSRQSVLIFLSNVLGSLVGFATMFLILRYMDQGNVVLGIVAFGMGFAGLFSSINNLGFAQAHIKRISEGKDLAECNGTYIFIKLVLTSIYVGVVLTVVYLWTHLLRNGFESNFHRISIFVFMAYWAFFSFSNIFVTTFIGRKQIAKSQIVQITMHLSRFTGILIVIFLTLGVIMLMWSYAFGMLAAILVGLLLFRGTPVSMPSMEYLKSYTRFAFPLAISSILVIAATNMDVVIIQYFWGAIKVSYFFAAQRIWIMILSIGTAVATVIFPYLSQKHSTNQEEQANRIALLAEKYIAMITIPIVLFIITFTGQVVHVLLADSMLPAILTIQIMSISGVIYALNLPYDMLLMGIDRSDISGKLSSTRALLNISLSFLLVSPSIMGLSLFGLGPAGSAIASLITMLVITTIARYVAWKKTGISSDFRFLKHFNAAMLSSVILIFLGTSWATRWYTLSLLALLYLGVYAMILYAIGGLKKDDIALILDTLNPLKMLNYIVDELRGK